VRREVLEPPMLVGVDVGDDVQPHAVVLVLPVRRLRVDIARSSRWVTASTSSAGVVAWESSRWMIREPPFRVRADRRVTEAPLPPWAARRKSADTNSRKTPRAQGREGLELCPRGESIHTHTALTGDTGSGFRASTRPAPEGPAGSCRAGHGAHRYRLSRVEGARETRPKRRVGRLLAAPRRADTRGSGEHVASAADPRVTRPG
jgi:hypothetical protein